MTREDVIKALEEKGYRISEESRACFKPITLLWLLESTGKLGRVDDHKAFRGKSGRPLEAPSIIKPKAGWEKAVVELQDLLREMSPE